MADRTVKVTLLAQVNGYLAGMDQAAAATRKMSQDSSARLAQQRQAFEAVGRASIAVGTAITALAVLAVRRFAEFDQAMSQVKAITQETAENMNLLRDAALEAGGRTVFTATEAANAIEELGKNGLTTAEILGGGLDAALDLAAAGGLEVARAAEVAAITFKQFKLEGSDLPHVTDLLAAGAGKAAGDVDDLAQALNQAALVANQTGLSVEDTTGVLSAFADAGLLGSDAGTSFKSMLQRLTPVSKEAEREMENLGISAYDASGQFIGITKFAGVLQQQLSGLTDEQRNFALAQIFGTDAVRAATVLYQQGAEGIADYIEQTNDAGYAARVAADRLDNLAGDLEQLGGAFDTALIQSGSAANDVLRFLTQTATDAVNGFADMPVGVQQAALAVGAVSAAVLLANGAFLVGVPRIAEYRRNLETLGAGAQRASRFIGAVGKGVSFIAGLSAAALVLDRLANSGPAAAKGVEATLAALNADGIDGIFKDFSDDVNDLSDAFDLLLGSGIEDNAERFGSTLNDIFAGGQLSDQVKDTRQQFEALGTGLANLVNNGRADEAATIFERFAERAERQGYSVEQLKSLMPAYEEALAGAANATDKNADALAVLEGRASDAGDELKDLAETILNFGKATLDTRSATRQYEEAVDDLTRSLRENGRSLDVGTSQGRANEKAIDDLVESTLELASAILVETGSHEKASEAVQAGRDQLIAMLAQFKITGDEAEAYADKLGLIPSRISSYVTVETSEAEETVRTFVRQFEGKEIKLLLSADQVSVNGRIYGGLRGYDSGGYTGAGGKREPRGIVHAGEFVSTQETLAHPSNRAALEFMHAGGVIGQYASPRYASDSTSVSSSSRTEISIAANGVDPGTVTDLLVQRIRSGLVNIR